MTAIPSRQKSPAEVLSYSVDWSTWLGTANISTASWTVPTGLISESDSHDNDSATITLSGGLLNRTYRVTCHIVASDGLEGEQSFDLEIIER